MRKLKTISTIDVCEFETLVNNFLAEHEGATASFPAEGVAYLVYDEIDYNAKVKEMEERLGIKGSTTPVRDEYEAEGIRYLCKECPYLEIGKDQRRKWWPCKYATYGRAYLDSQACESFYKELKQGAVVPREV